jgi:hypothetical protein
MKQRVDKPARKLASAKINLRVNDPAQKWNSAKMNQRVNVT